MNFAFSIRVAGLSTFMLSIYLYLMDRRCNQQNLLFACSQSELVSQNFLLTEQTANTFARVGALQVDFLGQCLEQWRNCLD